MINIVRYFFLFILIISFQRCANQNSDYDDLLLQFSNGDFNKALATIQNIKSSGPDDETLVELEILQAKMERIELDFSKNESRIKNELMPYFPNISDERLREWEENKSLEMRIINGEKRYFRNAVDNLFRLDSLAKSVKEKKEVKYIDPLKVFCLQYTSGLLKDIQSGKDSFNAVKKYRIDFTITLKPDVIPAGEKVECWMPFPRESLPRQKNVKLVLVNSENYMLAENKNLQRSLYLEKIVEAGKATIFNYIAEFETTPQYFDIQPNSLKPYNFNSKEYKEFTAEQKPNIIFSDEIIRLSSEITNGMTNPFEKVKAIYYWIDKNITWASALEYSTFESIPEYVLQTKHGDCGMRTFLFMSLARYAGIPCKWQSGWMLHPGELNLHDWCEVYYEGIGWVPVDQSFGLQHSDNQKLKDFYISGIDEFRMIVNDDFGCEFEPKKQFYRSEPFDFQRGELEWKSGNIYFNQWDYHLNVTSLNE